MNPQTTLGTDELGHPVTLDIVDAKHILVAGVAGSGKSSFLHNLITTYCPTDPDNARFMLIDTKQLELDRYHNLPHLITDIISEPKKAILALRWAAKEMDRRLALFLKLHIRSHEQYPVTDDDKFPRLICLVDGFAELMQQFPKETAAVIERILDLGAPVGIHLILTSTHGTVRALPTSILSRIPTLIVGKMSSKLESKHLLGQSGAETLHAPDEVLYKTAVMKFPICVKTAHITDTEIETRIRKAKKSKIKAIIIDPTEGDVESDDMFDVAREAVIESGRASTSYLQRKLGIGYSRAARLMDLLEAYGVIGPENGSKPRVVRK